MRRDSEQPKPQLFLQETPARPAEDICLETRHLSLDYQARVGKENQTRRALEDVSLQIARKRVTAFIGPSGCGKSSLLRTFNRMTDLDERSRLSGKVLLEGEDIHARGVDVPMLRRRIGMVFQTPNPFPMSVYENVAFGLRLVGENDKRHLDDKVESCLRSAALWEEVKDRLHDSALGLSGGQQQRLVIARTLAVEPEVLLLDEPASALDPISTLKIEELIRSLRSRLTLIIVTHNMQQAARVSDDTAFLHEGRLVEFAPTDQLFTNPRRRQTEDYITGRFG